MKLQQIENRVFKFKPALGVDRGWMMRICETTIKKSVYQNETLIFKKYRARPDSV